MNIHVLVLMFLLFYNVHVLNGEESLRLHIGVGSYTEMKLKNNVIYKVDRSVSGDLPVGKEINICFNQNTWTNKLQGFPKEAVLILFSLNELIDLDNRNDYFVPGYDAYRGIVKYTGDNQISNVVRNIERFRATPTNEWLAVDVALRIGHEYVQQHPLADVYNKDTNYLLVKKPTRYSFGWDLLFDVKPGFLGGSRCSVRVGDDRQVKRVDLN